MISMILAFHERPSTGEYVIGHNGGLPWSTNEEYAKKDLDRFKELTMGKDVVMGRSTYDSIGKPLAGRNNFVLSSTDVGHPSVATINIKYLHRLLVSARDDHELFNDVFIIGGRSLYDNLGLIEYCDELHITQIQPSNGEEDFQGDITLSKSFIDDIYAHDSKFDIVSGQIDYDSTYTHFRRAK